MNKNQETANRLDNMNLSEQARDVINSTVIIRYAVKQISL